MRTQRAFRRGIQRSNLAPRLPWREPDGRVLNKETHFRFCRPGVEQGKAAAVHIHLLCAGWFPGRNRRPQRPRSQVFPKFGIGAVRSGLPLTPIAAHYGEFARPPELGLVAKTGNFSGENLAGRSRGALVAGNGQLGDKDGFGKPERETPPLLKSHHTRISPREAIRLGGFSPREQA
jgi:hypothetical protein